VLANVGPSGDRELLTRAHRYTLKNSAEISEVRPHDNHFEYPLLGEQLLWQKDSLKAHVLTVRRVRMDLSDFLFFQIGPIRQH
jgi:hypothetical protein